MPSAGQLVSPAGLCRLSPDLLDTIVTGRRRGALALSAGLAIALGAPCYGFVFGCWRSVDQGLVSAFKMPLLMALVTLVSIVINTMLAQVMGTRATLRQVCRCFLMGYAIVSVLLASLSPAMLLFVLQSPGPNSASAMTAYRTLLITHTAMVGLCGLLGNVKCYAMLKALTGSASLSWRVLLVWILVTGFAGTQLSWLLSPFLCRPDVPEHFFNTLAFKSNFFEYLWLTARGAL